MMGRGITGIAVPGIEWHLTGILVECIPTGIINDALWHISSQALVQQSFGGVARRMGAMIADL